MAEKGSTCKAIESDTMKLIASEIPNLHPTMRRLVLNLCGEFNDDPYALYKDGPYLPCKSVGEEF